jgi:methylenetetrahydrofolate dehydrogenase (NADP+)/methenyltetrahydrofolate cyclohydrolase
MMAARIIDGKAIAAEIRTEVKTRTKELLHKGLVPGLAVVLVGEDPASQIYVGHKAKACQEAGIKSEVIRLGERTSEEELLEVVRTLNQRADIHGILVQLPLPAQIREAKVIEALDPGKDVDGFHPVNAGRLFTGRPRLIPCTPAGCLELIKKTGLEIAGKNAVVVGRSNIVGKPMAALLLQEHATVTVCHSRTRELARITGNADILVVAVGKAEFITGEMIKPGAVVLDVGMNRLPSGKLAGDVEFSSASETAGWLTPVPGGVGPMTIAMLLKNTLEAMSYGKE